LGEVFIFLVETLNQLKQLIRKMICCFEAPKTRYAGDPCWSCINIHKNTVRNTQMFY